MRKAPEIDLPSRLNYLVQYCEKSCVADCCGIDAFDFSPLHIASFLSAYSGDISETDIKELELELKKAEELTTDLLPSDEGFICSIKGTNQNFSRDAFDSLIAELLHNIRVSPEVLRLSNQIRKSHSNG